MSNAAIRHLTDRLTTERRNIKFNEGELRRALVKVEAAQADYQRRADDLAQSVTAVTEIEQALIDLGAEVPVEEPE